MESKLKGPQTVEPLRVYLDQADWSYLSEGKFPAAELRLRDLGERGLVHYWISHEHLFETGGLTTGLGDRLAYLRGFPSTFRLECCSEQVLFHDFEVLFATAQGASLPTTLQVRGVALVGMTDGALIELARDARHYADSMRWGVAGERISRKARAQQAAAKDLAKQQAAEAKHMAAFLKGDWKAVQKRIGKQLGRWTWFDAANAKAWMVAASSGERLLERLGVPLLADGRWDSVFLKVVLPHVLFKAIRDRRIVSPGTVAKVAKLWRDVDLRPQLAPSLACVAAVIDNVDRRPKEAYGLDAEMDWRHAAYSPWVNVFTCDKRNHDHVRAVIGKSQLPARVLRTGHLDLVVKAVEEVLSVQGIPSPLR